MLFFFYQIFEGHTFDCHLSAPLSLESDTKEQELKGKILILDTLFFFIRTSNFDFEPQEKIEIASSLSQLKDARGPKLLAYARP